MEANLGKDSLEIMNAKKGEESETNQQSGLTEAIQALFDFLDQEVQIESQAKRVTLEAYKTQINHFLQQQNGKSALRRAGSSRLLRGQKRVVLQPTITIVDPESDGGENSDSESVRSFEGTPGFKKQQANMPMRMTRSQKQKKRKGGGTGRKRTAKQANSNIDQIVEEDEDVSERAPRAHTLRSNKKRRMQ